MALVVKNPPAKAGDIREAGSIPGPRDPLEEEMQPNPVIHSQRIPQTEESGGLWSKGS